MLLKLLYSWLRKYLGLRMWLLYHIRFANLLRCLVRYANWFDVRAWVILEVHFRRFMACLDALFDDDPVHLRKPRSLVHVDAFNFIIIGSDIESSILVIFIFVFDLLYLVVDQFLKASCCALSLHLTLIEMAGIASFFHLIILILTLLTEILLGRRELLIKQNFK